MHFSKVLVLLTGGMYLKRYTNDKLDGFSACAGYIHII